jgi:hypothetical protein
MSMREDSAVLGLGGRQARSTNQTTMKTATSPLPHLLLIKPRCVKHAVVQHLQSIVPQFRP